MHCDPKYEGRSTKCLPVQFAAAPPDRHKTPYHQDWTEEQPAITPGRTEATTWGTREADDHAAKQLNIDKSGEKRPDEHKEDHEEK